MHAFLRERVLDLALQKQGAYRFFEERRFVEVTPLVKVNPFGLILDARRRRTPPAQLLEEARVLEEQYLVPLPGLARVAHKLQGFTRGVDLVVAIGDGARVRDFLAHAGLDALVGTLLVFSLADAHRGASRASLEEEEESRKIRVALADAAPTLEVPAVPVPDSDLDESAKDGAEAQRVREEIFALYLRFKPMTRPSHVLGVPLDADLPTIRDAYERIMRDLDPERVPEGSARALLVSRIEELRGKVTRAYEAMRLMLDGGARTVPPEDTNPW